MASILGATRQTIVGTMAGLMRMVNNDDSMLQKMLNYLASATGAFK